MKMPLRRATSVSVDNVERAFLHLMPPLLFVEALGSDSDIFIAVLDSNSVSSQKK